MGECCGVPPDEPRSCPACQRAGRRVDRITVKAMLGPVALQRLSDPEHLFCSTPDCSVVYFGLSERFERGEHRRPGLPEGTSRRTPSATASTFRESDVRWELIETHRSGVVECIATLVKAGRCACEVKNPQGSCCLGNVAAAVRAAEVALGTAAAIAR